MIRVIKIISPLIISGVILLTMFMLFEYQPLHALRSELLVESVEAHLTESAANKEEAIVLMDSDFVDVLKKAIEIDPNNCHARGILGAYYHTKTYGDEFDMKPGDSYNKELANAAVNEFEQIIQRCPNTKLANAARYFLAMGYYYSSQPTKALNQLDVFLAENPQSDKTGLIYAIRANLYDAVGDVENTYDSIRKSIFYEEKKNTISQLIIHLNEYIKQNPGLTQNLMPNSVSGFGRLTTAVVTSDQKIHMIGMLQEEHSFLHFSLEKHKWVAEEILLVKDDVFGIIDVDSQNRIHIAYSSGNIIYYVQDLNKNFEDLVTIDINEWALGSGISDASLKQVMLSIPPPEPSQLQMALSKNNIAHIVWLTPNYGLTYSTIDLDGKSTEPELIAPLPSRFTSLVVSDTEDVYIGYTNSSGLSFPSPDTKAWFRAKKNGSWGDPIQIGQNNVWTGGVSLAIASDQTIHLVYITGQSVEDAKLMHVSISPQGIWSNPEIIGDGNFRPWIPENYGGRYTVAMSILKDDSLAVAWRIPDDNTGTPLVACKLTLSGWEPIYTIGFIEGSDVLESPSVVKQANPLENIVKLIWADNGKIILFDWNP